MDKEIQKRYIKETPDIVEAVNEEHTFLTLKDHKQEFQTNPKVRLINPTKPGVGREAKKILDDMVKEIKAKNEKLMLATNTREVLEWFKSIRNKKIFKFINFDIDSFYPSITPALLKEALEWAIQ